MAIGRYLGGRRLLVGLPERQARAKTPAASAGRWAGHINRLPPSFRARHRYEVPEASPRPPAPIRLERRRPLDLDASLRRDRTADSVIDRLIHPTPPGLTCYDRRRRTEGTAIWADRAPARRSCPADLLHPCWAARLERRRRNPHLPGSTPGEVRWAFRMAAAEPRVWPPPSRLCLVFTQSFCLSGR
jgi:hypothetical protein